jgi:hypothetical protein
VRWLYEKSIWTVLISILCLLNWEEFATLWIILPDLELLQLLSQNQLKQIFNYNSSFFFKNRPDAADDINFLNLESFGRRRLDGKLLLLEKKNLDNDYTTMVCAGSLSYGSGLCPLIAFNPVYDLIALNSSVFGLGEKFCTRIEHYDFRPDNTRPRIVYEIQHRYTNLTPFHLHYSLEWSPDGQHLAVVEGQSAEKGTVHFYRYNPKTGKMRMLSNISSLYRNFLCFPPHLGSRHLWISDNKYLLPRSEVTYSVVEIEKKGVIITPPRPFRQITKRPLPVGCLMVLRDIGLIAYLEDCVRGEYDFIRRSLIFLLFSKL